MKRTTANASSNAVFSKPSKAEQKIDSTTRLVRSIIDGEAAKRKAKTERLRAERLAQEALAAPEPEPKKPQRAPRKRASAPAR
jgi:hypothetical protein